MLNWHLWLKRAIGVLFIYGGIAGVIALIPLVKFFNFQLVFLVFYLFSMVAGVYLLEGKGASVVWVKFIAFMQIPIISAPWISYHLSSGYAVTLTVKWPTFKVGAAIGPQHLFTLSGSGPVLFGVNLLAVVIFLYFHRYYRKEQ